MRIRIPILLLSSVTAWAATIHVSPSDSAHAVQTAVDRANPGDTLVLHAGTYRERVRISKSGSAQSPIVIAAAAGETVVLTGADEIPASEWERLTDGNGWRHTPWSYRGPTHPNDDRHRLIGRTEQVIVDGRLLRQVEDAAHLEPGTFCADSGKELRIRLAADDAPARHRIEVSVRPSVIEITGSYIVVRNLFVKYASNPAQRAAVDIGGRDNLIEDCVSEWTNGAGVRLGGDRNTARRVVSRFHGQMGMSGHGSHNLLEECRLEDNNVKGYSKMWEAGGIKVVMTRGFIIRRCRAVRNDGPGFWFDIDNRDGVVEQSYAAFNNGAGIFAEISETITIRNNLAVRNGLKDEPGSWNNAGILLGEAMRCVVENNVSIGNRHGIEVRQQRVRELEADPARGRPEKKLYYSDGHQFRHNISAFNREYQFALFGDNAFFGAKREVPAEDLERMDPDKRGWRAEGNLYFAAPGQRLILWGAKWLPKHQEYSTLDTFLAGHGLEQGSAVADPLFINWQAEKFELQPASPARTLGAGIQR